MAQKSIPASITAKAFSCPHCGAYTSQTWYNLTATQIPGNGIPGQQIYNYIRLLEGSLPLDRYYSIYNANISQCYACSNISVWVLGSLVYPHQKYEIEPNSDLPEEILIDFNEARAIVDDSPRGAAALLRLSIQKLCIMFGSSGKNINDDIASLVQKGLNPRIQKALDVVRVVGNEAVHPCEMDLNDDRTIAYNLFDLVNIIADEMISRPKQIDEIYNRLPESKLEGIKQRDNASNKCS